MNVAESMPNQSLEPTRVGRPPLAAQLQRSEHGKELKNEK